MKAYGRIKDSTGKRGDGEETNADEEYIQFYSGNKALPLFSNKPEVMKPKTVVTTLLQKDLPSTSKVCSIQPLEVYHHATFLVDLEAPPSTQDITCDDLGNWRNNSNDKFYFSVEWMDDNSAQVTAAESNDPDVETLKREYYMLKHENDFKKRIDILFWESTRDQLKIFAGEMKAREAVHHAITDGLGGLQSCVGLGQVPRNRQQVKDMARWKAVSKGSYPKNMLGAKRTSDPWYMLLNESKIQGRYPKTAYIRDVRVGAEPFCVVGTNR